MATVYLLDSVKVATPTTGTGSVTVGAAEPGYLTPAEAGAVNGRVYTWRLDDGDDFEIFVGTYSSTGPTVSRDTVLYSKISGVAGTSKINLSGLATLSAVPVADYVVTPRQIREKLTADRTYYVRTDGSDSNDGLTNSPGGAFRTIQKACDVVFGTLDLGGNNVTIQIGDGTYTAGVNQTSPQVGAGTITFQGNTSTPANVIVSVTSGSCFVATNAGVQFWIDGMELRTTTSGNCVEANQGATVYVGSNMRFGTCATRHVMASRGGVVFIDTGYSIVGGASAHFFAEQSGIIFSNGDTFTLSGTPAFSVFAQAVTGGNIRCTGATFFGSATGTRYSVTGNSVINTAGGGADYFPGNAAGSTATGGQYL